MWSMHFIIYFEISLVNFWNVFVFLLCFDDHGTWLQLLEYFWWFVQVPAIFERLFSCYFVVPFSLRRKFRKKNTHTHTTVFLWNTMSKVFLNYLFLQKQILQKYNFPKYIFRKNLILQDNTKILVSYIDTSVRGSSIFCFLNV